MREKHFFALHTTQPIVQKGVFSVGSVLELRDSTLWHRVVNVLHMIKNDEVIIFDGRNHLSLKLLSSTFTTRGLVEGIICKISESFPLTPKIHLYQGVVKKATFEQIAYYAAQMGVASVTPVITEKVQHPSKNNEWSAHLEKVMITACEQAKQFIIPIIKKSKRIDLLSSQEINGSDRCFVYFDHRGKPLCNLLSNLIEKEFKEIYVLIGPEGGLTNNEKSFLNNLGIRCHSLTPTVLRSQEAVTVAVGTIRSVAP